MPASTDRPTSGQVSVLIVRGCGHTERVSVREFFPFRDHDEEKTRTSPCPVCGHRDVINDEEPR
jgi:hypothetical protein